MRRKIVAGNWKMNKTIQEGNSLVSEIANMVRDEVHQDVLVVLAPPFPHLYPIHKLTDTIVNIHLSAQNCAQMESGAYTGEVSAEMLKSLGCRFVILGHSERREYFKETDQELAAKVNVALKNQLEVIFCCGESLELRESGNFLQFIESQLQNSLFHLPEADFRKIVIAYEPIWAIGTGKTASSQQAQEVHAAIRQMVAGKYGQAVADDCSILYGGSCKPDNARELFACADVDGGLIGGAALKSRDFVDIIKSF